MAEGRQGVKQPATMGDHSNARLRPAEAQHQLQFPTIIVRKTFVVVKGTPKKEQLIS